jgi:nucleoside 2-deoxyribosyltransferase
MGDKEYVVDRCQTVRFVNSLEGKTWAKTEGRTMKIAILATLALLALSINGAARAEQQNDLRDCTNPKTGAAMQVYVASPLGFSEAERFFYYDKLIPMLKNFGCEILDPWKLTPRSKIDTVAGMPYGPARKAAWEKLNMEIGANNKAALAHADMVFAVLDGVDVDSGTAAEVGFSFALGKKILGYRGDFRLAGDNDGAVINLQVEYFIRASGGDIVSSMGAVPGAIKRIALAESR